MHKVESRRELALRDLLHRTGVRRPSGRKRCADLLEGQSDPRLVSEGRAQHLVALDTALQRGLYGICVEATAPGEHQLCCTGRALRL